MAKGKNKRGQSDKKKPEMNLKEKRAAKAAKQKEKKRSSDEL